MNFDKKSKNTIIGVIFIFLILLQFLPTLLPSYTNSDSPAHFTNALFFVSDKPYAFPQDIFHYRFDSRFLLSAHATIAVDAYVPLPITYLILLAPFFIMFSPMVALSFLYLLTAIFSGLNALIIYKWVSKETKNDSAGMLSAIIFGIMPSGYIFFMGGDFPQIMGQLFVLLSIYSVYYLYDDLKKPKSFFILTGILTISLLIHLGSTISILCILFFIFVYKLYKIFTLKSEEQTTLINKFTTLFYYCVSVLVAFGASIVLYYVHFLDVFLTVGGQSTTGSYFIPSLIQIQYLFRDYWIFPIFILTGWFLLKEHKQFRAYLYLWMLVSLIFFIVNVDIRYVYLLYAPISIVSGITLNKLFDNVKYRKYVIYFLIIVCIASFIYYASWWTYFKNMNYTGKILNAIGALR